METAMLFSAIGGTLTTVSFLPQAVKTIKTRNTHGISLWMYLLFAIGVIFWTIFGFLINNPPTIIANAITLILSFIILIIKAQNIINHKEQP